MWIKPLLECADFNGIGGAYSVFFLIQPKKTSLLLEFQLNLPVGFVPIKKSSISFCYCCVIFDVFPIYDMVPNCVSDDNNDTLITV